MTSPLTIPGLPFTLSPSSEEAWSIGHSPVSVSAVAAPRSDIFIDPGTSSELNAASMLNAETLLGPPPAGDFQFSARVTVDFASTYDAGVLLLWLNKRNWAKLCFEFSPRAEPTIVSVVNRGVSDDANAFGVSGTSTWLRVARLETTFAYHASLDGVTWQLVRCFALDSAPTPLTVGFEAQSPTGDGCRVVFDQISFVSQRLANLRDGS